MQESFLHDMRCLLLAERASVEAELARLRAITAPDETQSEHAGLGNHMADDASDLFEQEKNLSLQQHTAHILAQVNAALRRLDQGNYGLCEQCGNAIDRERLATLPYAALCVACKSRQEKA